MLKEQIIQLKQEILTELEKINSLEALEQLRLIYLSRQGKIAQLMPLLKDLSTQEKQVFGPLLNDLKQTAQEAFIVKKEFVVNQQLNAQLSQQKNFDVTAYLPGQMQGSLHPLTYMQQKVENVFISMGYHIIDGPEVEREYYNFTALNIPEHHPARDISDTFWLDVPGMLLRTHTSSVQIHAMEHHKPPLALVAIGRVYRHEATDATHDFMFNQVEGLCIDKNISLAHLLATTKSFFRAIFDKKNLELRVRTSYFPFVEPGIEIDISCPFCKSGCSACKRSGWIEMGGAGLVHPNVLQCSKISPKDYSGFAFGFGLDRITMLLYNIHDVRLFSSNKVEFLKQF